METNQRKSHGDVLKTYENYIHISWIFMDDKLINCIFHTNNLRKRLWPSVSIVDCDISPPNVHLELLRSWRTGRSTWEMPMTRLGRSMRWLEIQSATFQSPKIIDSLTEVKCHVPELNMWRQRPSVRRRGVKGKLSASAPRLVSELLPHPGKRGNDWNTMCD